MLKKIFKIFTAISALIILLVFISNYTIERNASNKTYIDPELIPKNKVGLVLGTTKNLKDGRVNLYFTYRINAALALYNKNKIDYILISGDNGHKNYDEPSDFKNELIKRGIPEDRIFLDYAGFRTLDSVIRSKEIFGQNAITIISQEFHNERAIYIAEKNNINAIGFNAKNLSGKYGLKVQLREYLARTKVFIDIIFNIQPKYLGEKIAIE